MRHIQVEGIMADHADELIDEQWVDDKIMEEQMDARCMHAYIHGCMNAQMHGCMDR